MTLYEKIVAMLPGDEEIESQNWPEPVKAACFQLSCSPANPYLASEAVRAFIKHEIAIPVFLHPFVSRAVDEWFDANRQKNKKARRDNIKQTELEMMTFCTKVLGYEVKEAAATIARAFSSDPDSHSADRLVTIYNTGECSGLRDSMERMGELISEDQRNRFDTFFQSF